MFSNQPGSSMSRRHFHSIIRLILALSATVCALPIMAAINQSFTMANLGSKTYGDAPFIVTATANLPITKWESLDPSVAEVSSTGLVTIVGAGQTSIIASNSGNDVYNAGWIAKPLNVALSSAALPTESRTVTYDGSAKALDPTPLPSGEATEITYRDVTLPDTTSSSQLVYQNGPDTLASSYTSTGMNANKLSGLAKYVRLGGTARKLASCDVTLVTWAKYAEYSTWITANPALVVAPNAGVSIPGDSGGYYHPITLSFYDYDNLGTTESFRMLTTMTVRAFIPWRPLKQADGVSNYDFNGYAFRVPFNFPDGIILPPDVWIAVTFNTNLVGPLPIGVPGPYDSLNIPIPSGPVLAGSTIFSTSLIFKDWRWHSAYDTIGPVLRLRAIPTHESIDAPTNAGTYEVKTQAALSGQASKSTTRLIINKAPLQINLSNLNQIRDGDPKPLKVQTIPPNIQTSLSYSGSPNAPTDKGFYPVLASSANPNYEGQSNATLHIGESYTSWQTAAFASSGLPPEETEDSSDPDGDGHSNFLEYASNLNPLKSEHAVPSALETTSDSVAFTYRRNIHALDLDYMIQNSTQLGDSSQWIQTTPLSETTLSDDGSTQVVRASVAKPFDAANFFLRLKVSR
jgi:hypothetical protein